MIKNEYESLEQFTSQYVGEWNPSAGHWFGLDFVYCGEEYRLHTGWMYKDDVANISEDEVMFSLYKKKMLCEGDREYELLGLFSCMDDLLECTVIQGKSFKEVIVDEDTELVGQD